jgi:hypothetical protein
VSWLEVLAVIGIIGFVIYQQLAGQLLQGKRVVVLPAVVTVIGFVGLNRLGQAAVIVPRAMRAGIPFAPEKNGSTFLGDAFGGHDRDTSGRY